VFAVSTYLACMSSCYLILVGMGLHWLGYDIGFVGKVGRNMLKQIVQGVEFSASSIGKPVL
jgi:hypothetical protein